MLEFSSNKENQRTIIGDDYTRLMGLIFQYADTFSLIRSDGGLYFDDSLENELEKYKVKEIQTDVWFGYDFSLANENPEIVMDVKVYLANDDTKSILLKYFNDIFLEDHYYFENKAKFQEKVDKLVDEWISQEEAEYRQYWKGPFYAVLTLRDLCFFKEEEMFFGTVSHENILRVWPPNMHFVNEIMKLGKWRSCDD